MQFERALAWSAAPPLEGWNGIDRLFQHLGVVHVGSRLPDGERRPGGRPPDGASCPICRDPLGFGRLARPPGAGTLAESRLARDQSICSAACRRSQRCTRHLAGRSAPADPSPLGSAGLSRRIRRPAGLVHCRGDLVGRVKSSSLGGWRSGDDLLRRLHVRIAPRAEVVHRVDHRHVGLDPTPSSSVPSLRRNAAVEKRARPMPGRSNCIGLPDPPLVGRPTVVARPEPTSATMKFSVVLKPYSSRLTGRAARRRRLARRDV